MGGSTGEFSGVHIAPDNHYSQRQKSVDAQGSGFPSTTAAIRPRFARVVGPINKEHPKLVRVRDYYDNSPIGNDGEIELDHSVEEIAERWGTIRPGFIVRVLSHGLGETGSFGVVVGTEGSKTDSVGVENDVGRGLYAIFAPGIGLG